MTARNGPGLAGFLLVLFRIVFCLSSGSRNNSCRCGAKGLSPACLSISTCLSHLCRCLAIFDFGCYVRSLRRRRLSSDLNRWCFPARFGVSRTLTLLTGRRRLRRRRRGRFISDGLLHFLLRWFVSRSVSGSTGYCRSLNSGRLIPGWTAGLCRFPGCCFLLVLIVIRFRCWTIWVRRGCGDARRCWCFRPLRDRSIRALLRSQNKKTDRRYEDQAERRNGVPQYHRRKEARQKLSQR
jgi:hypothetical protein